MKIAFIISSLGSGGAERVLINLANYFSKNKEVYIVTFSNEKPFYDLDKNIQLIQLNLLQQSKNIFETIYNTLKRIWRLKSILNDLKPDINISFMTHTNILSIIASKLNRQKIIISERIAYDFYSSKILNLLRRLIYPLSDFLIVQTNADLKNYYFVKNKKFIYNPLSFSNNELPLKKEKIILSVGRLDKQKGFDTLIEIYSMIEIDWKLYIAGDGVERKNLEYLIKKLKLENKVTLLGIVKDIEKWYLKASIFVLSSRKEGFPNVLIEAMAYGCAVVSYDCPYGPGEIIENYKNGILVENQNKEKLKEAIEKLIKDKNLREKLGKEAIKVREKYSIEKIANEWERVIGVVI